MPFKYISLLLLILCIGIKVNAQLCTTLGQTPTTAFPVCGTSVFQQDTVPQCSNGEINPPTCNATGPYPDVNPFWYKFTCYSPGTLDFLITPNNLGDDYDWQLFDITNVASPNDVYTNPKLFVVGNWSGSSGKTGTAPGNTDTIECASNPVVYENTFSKPPFLIQGHTYLLLVSHYTQTQSGYSLTFNGGSAVITDTTQPALKSAASDCGGSKIGVLTNKMVKCSSLAADGSDFAISPPVANVISASGTNCGSSFDMDSIVLTLDKPLAPGTYQVVAKYGTDDNSLLDNCDNNIPVGDSVSLIIYPVSPTPFDSMTPIACAPNALQFVFRKNIVCNTIAPNGSDFVINGPSPVSISSATGSCNTDGTTGTITLNFSSPLVVGGNYTVTLVTGTDGNTIIDECGQETPAGSSINFTGSDTVSAVFNGQLLLGCKQDTIVLQHDGRNAVNIWNWVFDDGVTYTTQNVTRIYNDYGIKSVSLLVSNGVCTDSSSQSFTLNNQLKAAFSSPSLLCPNDIAVFKDSSIGSIVSWNWYFGNGNTSNIQDPPSQTYPISTSEKYYPIRLIVNNVNCFDTAYKEVKVLYNCYIAVPSAFTPNGDGKNDYLYPLNAYKAINLEFRVFNRWGQEVFETKDWTHKWDGTINGHPQASGVYVWSLTYTNVDTGIKYALKGTTVLIR